MTDHWLGRILDTIDRHDAWSTTAVVLCTDHGIYLGERGMWGKPAVAVHPELGHIPLLVAWPGVAAAERDALTTTVDLHATLCEIFGVTPEHRTHGTSLVPLLEGTTTSIREWALCGVWGREVHVADRTRTYAKAPVDGNRPLSMFSNRWSTMPVRVLPQWRLMQARLASVARPQPGHGRPRDPAAVRPERRHPVLGPRSLPRRPALRPRRGRRRGRGPQPRGRTGRQGDAGAARRGDALDRGARRAAGTASA